jgi:hypothetical protein
MEKKESWYKVEIRELIRKNLDKIHRKVGDSYGIDVSFLHKMISEYAEQELDKAREEGKVSMFKEIYREALGAGDLYKWVNDKQLEINKLKSKANDKRR